MKKHNGDRLMIKLISSRRLKAHKPSRIPKWMQSTLRKEHDEMIVQLNELQITASTYLNRLQTGPLSDVNSYTNKTEQTTELVNKYQGASSYGTSLIKRLVNVAAAMQVPNGISLEGDHRTPEYEYLNLFLDASQLNEGVAIQLAKEAQFEGQVLLELLWDMETNMVKIRHILWRVGEYEVRPIGISNLTGPYEATWSEEGQVVRTLTKDQMAFVAFNTTRDANDYITGWPTLGGLLTRIEAISHDLVDWRTSNKLYAHPTPVFTCETQDEVNALTSKLEAVGWTVGTAIAFRGEFVLAAVPNYHRTILDAITTNVKIISGGSGVSIGWLGFTDVMSNRATAESLGEPLEIVASADIATWTSFYEELFDSVINIRNKNIISSQKLKTGLVKPKLKPMSDRQWQKLKDLFMPAAEKNLLTRESFLEQIPNFNIEAELKRIKDEEAKLDAEMQVSLDNVPEEE